MTVLIYIYIGVNPKPEINTPAWRLSSSSAPPDHKNRNMYRVKGALCA